MNTQIDKKAISLILKKDLKEYEALNSMSLDERRALRDWVSGGNSVYENGSCYSQENGAPMSFLDAYRYNKEFLHAFKTGGDNNE